MFGLAWFQGVHEVIGAHAPIAFHSEVLLIASM